MKPLPLEYSRRRVHFQSDALRVAIVFAAAAFGSGALQSFLLVGQTNSDGFYGSMMPYYSLLRFVAVVSAIAGLILFVAIKLRERRAQQRLYARGPFAVVLSGCAYFVPGFVGDLVGAPAWGVHALRGFLLIYPILCAMWVVSIAAPPDHLRD